MLDKHPIQTLNWRIDPLWKQNYALTEDTLEKIKNIRKLALSRSQKSLKKLNAFVNDPSWKVRSEVVRALKRFIETAQKPTRETAIKTLYHFDNETHPMVEVCVEKVHLYIKKLKRSKQL